jgi:hypothetical protein
MQVSFDVWQKKPTFGVAVTLLGEQNPGHAQSESTAQLLVERPQVHVKNPKPRSAHGFAPYAQYWPEGEHEVSRTARAVTSVRHRRPRRRSPSSCTMTRGRC